MPITSSCWCPATGRSPGRNCAPASGSTACPCPNASLARHLTGYDRGTITALGATAAWPVISDERVLGREITLGSSEHGVAVAVLTDDVLAVLNATVADVTEPEDVS